MLQPSALGHPRTRNYSQTPLLVYWEMTQACRLACRHCRAEAIPTPSPLELSYEEGRRLLEQIADFGNPLPHLVLTGGDPLARSDLLSLIHYARTLGIDVSITPSVTQDLTAQKLLELKLHGIQSLGLSLDGSTAERHERIRGVPGCFSRTIQTLREAIKLDLPVQINTLVSQETSDDLPALYQLLQGFPIMRWSLFFLIPMGRGHVLRGIAPEQGEVLMHWVYDLARTAPFALKTTEAPSYRRVAIGRMREEGLHPEQIRGTPVGHGFGIRDGHGIVFVSHTGVISPSGFLPVKAGNVRRDHLVAIYRTAPVFQGLHDPGALTGKCGLCQYRAICGGSRARAFATTGSWLASDPLCPYQPEER